MNYEKKSFSVPASAGTAAYCAEHGHTMPDIRGDCVRCGEPTTRFEFLRLTQAELAAMTPEQMIDEQRRYDSRVRSTLCHDYLPDAT